MSRSETTKQLSALTEKHIDCNNDPRIYWSKEVTFDYATSHHVRVDYMQFKPLNNTVSGIEKGDFYCFEVKSSVEDFHSKNGHNFIGDFNYYVMPEEIFDAVAKEIPYDIGVYTPCEIHGGSLFLKTPARRRSRTRPVSEMLMMMWRSDRRELVKQRRSSVEQDEN